MCYDVLRLGGASRLVDLCRDPQERNFSDAVLVAALAVLRRLKANLDTEEVSLVFGRLEAEDLRAMSFEASAFTGGKMAGIDRPFGWQGERKG